LGKCEGGEKSGRYENPHGDKASIDAVVHIVVGRGRWGFDSLTQVVESASHADDYNLLWDLDPHVFQ
jgi:hypothetical protein